ncbi:MAG: DUF115 domain-containing protein [bacterium]|nr:DUF115 domain-containing protein [bacterium]
MQLRDLKKSKLVRIGSFPFANLSRQLRKLTFQYTIDAKKLRSFKDSHPGERCFIIGNGPSLSAHDLDQLKDEFTFGFNKILEIFPETDWRPSMYMCVELNTLCDCQKGIRKLTMPTFILKEGKKYFTSFDSHITYICNHVPFLINRYKRVDGIYLSEDVSKYFIGGETVVFNAIQMAIYMGFKEIYLLGVDHSYSKKVNSKGVITVNPDIKDYFGNVKTTPYTLQTIDTVNAAYRSCKDYCTKHNIIIKNLTRGGILDIFDRDNFDQILLNGGVKHAS